MKEHGPEIRKLYGNTPKTFWYAMATVIGAYGSAYFVHTTQSWLLTFVLLVAWGPWWNMMALVVIHEVCHNLVFKKPWKNRMLGILVNMPMVLPVSEIFRQHHLAHHLNLGDHYFDVDVPADWETKGVKNNSFYKFLWLFWNPFIIISRSLLKLPVRWDLFVAFNWVSCLGTSALIGYLSPRTLIYLFCSAFLSQSFHPSNARVIQRHVSSEESARLTDRAEDPNTYSYYGPMNLVTLNVGFHVEHHDFSRVPWPNLPALHKIGGEKWYPEKGSHPSRSFGAVIEFVMNDNIWLDWFSARQGIRGAEERRKED